MEQISAWQIGCLFVIVSIASAISIYAAGTAKGKGKYLCEDCRFNNDHDCQKPERPHALVCTSYREKTDGVAPVSISDNDGEKPAIAVGSDGDEASA